MKSDKQYTTLSELFKSFTNVEIFYHSHRYKAQQFSCPIGLTPDEEKRYELALKSIPFIYSFEDGVCYAMVSANSTRSSLDRCEYLVYSCIEYVTNGG